MTATWFIDGKKTETRKFLCLLQGLSVINLIPVKLDNGVIEYRWNLSEKGKALIFKNKELEILWDSKDIEQFYYKLKEILNQ
ncbi:MAG: hypothetical protein WC796_03945 [Candidatus Pacearchaeota archaeon]|jgi:hypothetical protein